MRIFNLVKRMVDGCDVNVYISTYKIDDSVKNPEEALRSAVDEFLKTPEGEEAIRDTCNDFNWGDVDTYMPEEILNKYGIYSLGYTESIDLEVNHDEILC